MELPVLKGGVVVIKKEGVMEQHADACKLFSSKNENYGNHIL
jgi:hypothetical protein